MDQVSRLSPLQRIKRLAGVVTVLLATVMLSGCQRPMDEDINTLLSELYQCKGIKVVDMIKTDSLPGIFTYVAQYNFLVTLKYGEKDALYFYRDLLKLASTKGNNWKDSLSSDKLQDYFLDNCNEGGQTVVEIMLEDVLQQLAEKKQQIKLPITVQMNGWSELMTSRKHETGWTMTIRRDRFGHEMAYSSKPVSRKALLHGTGKR